MYLLFYLFMYLLFYLFMYLLFYLFINFYYYYLFTCLLTYLHIYFKQNKIVATVNHLRSKITILQTNLPPE